ncbi:protein FAR-RED IMPAIRED RESPONSE 1-like [Ziziphus jujuba]|uniref:Protein FAR1-RELATED SEQUENCE n=1 Tax=Ziziphus jujuba TaxID=326968 RepID=A0ABM4AAX1_ZIZJJ|nr:protein FAR-RED IMPAIRED RESPONSE 1-like [Ziziphus jujuba]
MVFACAFLSDERNESFVLKKSMPTNNPKMIIIVKAIAKSLLNTFHRYCSWHILDKFSIYLNVITYKDFHKDFQRCIWESKYPEEFERKWVTIIEKANLYDNDWLKSIFEIHLIWVPAYVNHVFSAGMSSSQHAESSHTFFKKYVSKKNLLMDFILRFNRASVHQHHEKLAVDHVDINEEPLLKLPLEMEKQMVEIYTYKIFYKFQDELWHRLVTMPQIVSENDTYKIYKKFESEGIPYRHILTFLQSFGNVPFPNHKLFKLASKLLNKAITNKEAAVIVNDGLQSLLDKIKSVVGSTKSGGISEKCSNIYDTTLKDPSQVRANRCGRRLKKGKEKATNAAKYRGRYCNGRGKIG